MSAAIPGAWGCVGRDDLCGQPILDAQAGDLLEVAKICREQQGVMRKCDGRDFEVLSADADFLFAEIVELICSGRADGDDCATFDDLK